jgi:hypothetical protein
LQRNCLLKHVSEGKIEGTDDEEEDVSSYWKTLRGEKKNIQEFETGSTRSHFLENSI